MPRLYVPTDALGGSDVALDGEAHRYLTRVLRLRAGARVDLFDGCGLEVAATVVTSGVRQVTLALGARRHVARSATPPVTLLQGLPRPERMDLVVQKAAELGAARVVPVRTARSATGQQGRPDRWSKIAREAARQCGRPDGLDVAPLQPLADAIASLASATARFVPWEDAPDAPALATSLANLRTAGGVGGVDVLIGPEGGLTPEEVALATESGFTIVTLGPRILRTETAAIAVLALIQGAVGGLG